jgi:hypothetical protein
VWRCCFFKTAGHLDEVRCVRIQPVPRRSRFESILCTPSGCVCSLECGEGKLAQSRGRAPRT